MFLLILIPLCFYLPTFFVIIIKRSNENSDYFNRDLKESANNIFFRNYFLLLIFFENILPLVILLTMTVLCHNEYKKRIQIKSRIIIQAITNHKKTREQLHSNNYHSNLSIYDDQMFRLYS